MIGGYTYPNTFNSTWEYNIVENKIVPKDGMNQRRREFGIAFDQLQSTIYVLGGYDDGFLSHCEKYSIENNKWTVFRSMKVRKWGVSACIVDNMFVYAIGGYNFEKNLDTIEKYNIQNDKWETVKYSVKFEFCKSSFTKRAYAFSW